MLVEFEIECPHCGEAFTTMIDTSEGDYATIEDCAVCCRPMSLDIACEPGTVHSVAVSPL